MNVETVENKKKLCVKRVSAYYISYEVAARERSRSCSNKHQTAETNRHDKTEKA